MRKFKLSKGRSKKMFRNGATKTRGVNMIPLPMRGGFRL